MSIYLEEIELLYDFFFVLEDLNVILIYGLIAETMFIAVTILGVLLFFEYLVSPPTEIKPKPKKDPEKFVPTTTIIIYGKNK
jgi:hypothetical protein